MTKRIDHCHTSSLYSMPMQARVVVGTVTVVILCKDLQAWLAQVSVKRMLAFQTAGLLSLLCLWLDTPKELELCYFFLEPKDTHISPLALLSRFFQFFPKPEVPCRRHGRVPPRYPSREDLLPQHGGCCQQMACSLAPSGTA